MIACVRGLRVPLLLVVTLFFCVTIHELGHALAAFATGGRVKSFHVLGFRPHVSVEGKFTEEQKALKSIAGSGTFLIAWALFIVSLPRGNSKLFEIKAATAFFAFIEVLGWTLASLQYPYGPRSDDPWKFIAFTGLDPAFVTAACLGMMGMIWALYRSRTRPALAPAVIRTVEL